LIQRQRVIDSLLPPPWGFDPASISVPIKVWHGLDDQFMPIEHGRWLAENIRGAQADYARTTGT
jgi:pimeloyl-ACP methyl ester carboxylesterase